jgi:hypothetical protein
LLCEQHTDPQQRTEQNDADACADSHGFPSSRTRGTHHAKASTGRQRPSSSVEDARGFDPGSHSYDEGSVSQSFERKTDYAGRMASDQSARGGQGKTEFSFGWVADLNSRQSEQGSPPTLPLPPWPLRQAPNPQSHPRPSVSAGWPWCGSPRCRWYFVPRPTFS